MERFRSYVYTHNSAQKVQNVFRMNFILRERVNALKLALFSYSNADICVLGNINYAKVPVWHRIEVATTVSSEECTDVPPLCINA